jgi:hypothetical protein
MMRKALLLTLLSLVLVGCLVPTHARLDELDTIAMPGDLEALFLPVLTELAGAGATRVRFHVDRTVDGIRHLVLSYRTARGTTEARFWALMERAEAWLVLARVTVEINTATGDATGVTTGFSPALRHPYTFWAGCILDRQIVAVQVVLVAGTALDTHQSGRFFFLYLPEAATARHFDLLDRHGAVVRNLMP